MIISFNLSKKTISKLDALKKKLKFNSRSHLLDRILEDYFKQKEKE